MDPKHKPKCDCPDCEGEAAYFHSKCCGAHFEGVVLPSGKMAIVCERCGLFVALITKPEKEAQNGT